MVNKIVNDIVVGSKEDANDLMKSNEFDLTKGELEEAE